MDQMSGSPVHALSPDVAGIELASDPQRGLDDDDVRQRRLEYGENLLPAARPRSAFGTFIGQFRNPLVYVLLGAIVVALAVGEWTDAGVIAAVVIANACIGYVQESRATSALARLATLMRIRSRALRSGMWSEIDSRDLVPGDVVALVAGDRVPADLRLIGTEGLCIDESALTGEAEAVAKQIAALPVDTALADRTNMAFSGTLVVTGAGTGLVSATGAQTQLGDIHRMLRTVTEVSTPLTRRLAQLSRRLTVVILALAAMTFVLGVWRGETAADMVSAAVALAVGAIPEGLPAAVTITLAIGTSRMAHRGAIVRRLPAIETLGSTTVVCTDKTGTLTRNEMVVESVHVGGTTYPAMTAPLEQARACLVAGAACTDAVLREEQGGTARILGDPTEAAMVALARDRGMDQREILDRCPRVGRVPFTSERGWMATLHETDGGREVLVKGSPETVLAMCRDAAPDAGGSTDLDRGTVQDAVSQLSARGLRVLALASGPAVALDAAVPRDLTLLGLQAMRDPLRPESRRAIGSLQRAGIRVIMITGDHPRTAEAIAREAGVGGQSPRVLVGSDLAGDDRLGELLEGVDVIARVPAGVKLSVVRALQARGHVVAMTGDGINDAPALKQADVGIAMGRQGTEVAKDSADIVLSDDNIATLEAAVEEGRSVYDNVVKFIAWTLPTNLGEGLLVLVAILLAAPLPLTPVQILWVNMTTAVALGLTLSFEPAEAGIMDRPPRAPNSSLFPAALIVRITLVGILMVMGSFTAFWASQRLGSTLDQSRTCAVNALVAMQIGYLLTCRSLTLPLHRLHPLGNRALVLGVLATLALQGLFTYTPWMQEWFGTSPPTGYAWLLVFGLGVAVFAVVSALDAYQRSRTLSGRVRRSSV